MKNYLQAFVSQSFQQCETFENVPPQQPTEPTKPSNVGFVGLLPDALPRVLEREAIRESKGGGENTFGKMLPALPAKPTNSDALKPCQRCDASMQHVEAGYFSCPACHFQAVEAKSGFWVTGIEQELRRAA